MHPGSLPVKTQHLPLLFLLSFLAIGATAQTHYTSASVDIVISGTSTLHDWTMRDIKADCTASIDLNADGQVTGVSALSFSTPVHALKSGHTAMDNNAYKSLKSDKAPDISYTMTSVTLSQSTAGSTVTCKGQLTIAGTTREEEVVAVCKPDTDSAITVTGSKAISMQQYHITPPTFMLGTVKTGNNITLNFHLTLKRA